MDDQDLSRILKDTPLPAADDNARKVAVNLALAAFEAHQKEKNEKRENSFQGFPILARLIGKSTPQSRSDTMEQKTKNRLMYGGLATAMVVVLAVGVSLQQSGDPSLKGAVDTLVSETLQQTATLSKTKEEMAPAGAIMDTPQEAEVAMADSTVGSSVNFSGQMAGSAPMAELKRGVAKGFVGAMPTSPSIAPYYPGDDGVVFQPSYQDVGRDKFQDFTVNPFKQVVTEPVSTFSIDVDTTSYSFTRRQLNMGVLPQKDAVRVEEMLNYFDYDYAIPETKEEPFRPSIAVTDSPWAKGKKLVHIGIKGYDIAQTEKPRTNLVFLLDISGSMQSPDKLPLLQNSMKMLLDTLGSDDSVAIAYYASGTGVILEPTKASEKAKIAAAINSLQAGGGTAGAEGISLAYQLAEQNFDKDAVNRVILATDGDFNIGITSPDELKDFVERKREKGIFLSVLGFGEGNYNDAMMQTLAQNGNGVAAYIDSLNEARKVLVEESSSTLFPIAKDVKIQVEFNPALVSEYRLIGYETRALAREDFNNDRVDAGDIGAGHSVTALYEVVPVGGPVSMDDLRYGQTEKPAAAPDKKPASNELGFLKLRYKLPKEDTSKLITTPIVDKAEAGLSDTQKQDVAWSTAVAGFGQILQGGKYTGTFNFDDVIALANANKGKDEFGYRAEFVQLVRLAKAAKDMQSGTPQPIPPVTPSPYPAEYR